MREGGRERKEGRDISNGRKRCTILVAMYIPSILIFTFTSIFPLNTGILYWTRGIRDGKGR